MREEIEQFLISKGFEKVEGYAGYPLMADQELWLLDNKYELIIELIEHKEIPF